MLLLFLKEIHTLMLVFRGGKYHRMNVSVKLIWLTKSPWATVDLCICQLQSFPH